MKPTPLGELEIEPLAAGKPACVLTVDVEDWFHANFRSAPVLQPEELPRRAEEGVERLLAALASSNAKGTFFVLGAVARDHPELVRRIADAGDDPG